MRKIAKFGAVVVAAALYSGLGATGAGATGTASRTFVSGQGVDTNPCTLAAPCRSFAQALTQTASGGEIVVLTSAGYGSLTISQSVAITNPGGVDAGITATGGNNAITINAGPSDVVTLRGLIIEGAGAGYIGILFNSGAELDVQNCVIRGFTGVGLYANTAASATLTATDTIASGNGGYGFVLHPPGSSGTALLQTFFTRVQATGNGSYGFMFDNNGSGGLTGTVVDSAAVNNGLIGFYAENTLLTLVNSTASFNVKGVIADPRSTVYLQHSTISNNGTGYVAIGTMNSFGNNAITDATNIGSLTPVGLQ